MKLVRVFGHRVVTLKCDATSVLLLALADLGETGLLPSQPTVVLFVLTFLFLLLSLLFIILIMQTARRIERFDEYTAEIQKKWGNEVPTDCAELNGDRPSQVTKL
jgi:hypothetical protein